MAQRFCQSCGAAITRDDPIPRDAECESCGRDLRACLNCRHYDTRYNNACTETQAEPVTDKGRRNFCEFFYFNPAPAAARGSGASREAGARAKLDSLFGGGSGARPDKSGEARKKLDDLFKKKD